MQKILVCDDDKEIVEAISIYLTGEGFEVIGVHDGNEALKKLEAGDIDLLILDVMMPGLDGIRTTLMVREKAQYLSLYFQQSRRMRIRYSDLI